MQRAAHRYPAAPELSNDPAGPPIGTERIDQNAAFNPAACGSHERRDDLVAHSIVGEDVGREMNMVPGSTNVGHETVYHFLIIR